MRLQFLLSALMVPFAVVAASAQAEAQSRLTLKSEVVVTSEVVRIGDLVENIGAGGDIAIFRSPDLGHTGSVPTEQIVEALRRHQVTNVDVRQINAVAVTRAGRPITPKDIEEALTTAIAGQQGAPPAKSLALTYDRELRTFFVSPASELRTVRTSYNPFTTRFDVLFEIVGTAGGQPARLRFSGTAVETVEVIALGRPLVRGDVIRASDVVAERRPKSTVTAGSLDRTEDVVGLAARQTLRAGETIRRTDLMKPELVRQNEPVIISFELPGMMLNARGKALESGAEGDIINVLNVQSKRTLQATVSGTGQVTLVPPGARVLDPEVTASISSKSRTRSE